MGTRQRAGWKGGEEGGGGVARGGGEGGTITNHDHNDSEAGH